MSHSQARQERLARLTGGDGEWGGGLPLPPLFSALLNELMDEGSATTERLEEITRKNMDFKEAQIITNQVGSGQVPEGQAPDWPLFTADILDQMSDTGFIRKDGDVWTTGPDFATGKLLEIIPARTKDGRKLPVDGTTVWRKEERERLNREAEARREGAAMLSQGIRPVDRAIVDKLRESATQFENVTVDGEPSEGRILPVVIDQHGRVLDGHHRRIADPRWPAQRVNVESDEEALALAAQLNAVRAPLKPAAQRRVEEVLLGMRSAAEIRKDRIRAALEGSELSHRALAEELGVSSRTVDLACAELMRTGTHYDTCPHRKTRSGGQAPGRKPKNERKPTAPPKPPKARGDVKGLVQAIRQKLESGEEPVAGRLAAEFGTSGDKAERELIAERRAYKARREERARLGQEHGTVQISELVPEEAETSSHEPQWLTICTVCGVPKDEHE